MDPAEQEEIRSALDQHRQALLQLQASVQQISAHLSAMPPIGSRGSNAGAAALAPPLPAPTPAYRPLPLNPPDRFDGNPTKCRGFLAQCALVFRLHPETFFCPQDKIAFIVSWLTGRALEWATALLDCGAPEVQDYDLFLGKFKGVFCRPVVGQDSAFRLSSIHQGRRSVQDYAIDFQVTAAETHWNDEVLIFLFRQGLSEEIKDRLVNMPQLGSTLEEVISQVLELDIRICQRSAERSRTPILKAPRLSPIRSFDSDQPMEVARTQLTPEERERRQREGRCMYCGRLGHFKAACPASYSSLRCS
uniref:CCHC-type domain-containing protein n=1 Tax=Lepisosteus oculatus TaxID=7918 RepID=W5NNH0_LEPOC